MYPYQKVWNRDYRQIQISALFNDICVVHPIRIDINKITQPIELRYLKWVLATCKLNLNSFGDVNFKCQNLSSWAEVIDSDIIKILHKDGKLVYLPCDYMEEAALDNETIVKDRSSYTLPPNLVISILNTNFSECLLKGIDLTQSVPSRNVVRNEILGLGAKEGVEKLTTKSPYVAPLLRSEPATEKDKQQDSTDEEKKPADKIINPSISKVESSAVEDNRFKELGRMGGKKSKSREELATLVACELKRKNGFKKFKEILMEDYCYESKPCSDDPTYEGYLGCQDIYLMKKGNSFRMYYTYISDDNKQDTRDIALRSLERYFTAERKSSTKKSQPN